MGSTVLLPYMQKNDPGLGACYKNTPWPFGQILFLHVRSAQHGLKV